MDFIPSMRQVTQSQAVRFLVVSTHHSSISGRLDTHGECCDMIRSFGGHILVEHDVQESFSGAGLIVASFFAASSSADAPIDEERIYELSVPRALSFYWQELA